MPKVLKKMSKPTRTTKAKKATSAAVAAKPLDTAGFSSLLKETAATYTKQVDLSKKTLQATKAKLEKAAITQKNLKEKRTALSDKIKSKATPAAKNQLLKAKQAYTTAVEQIAALKSEFENAKQALQSAKSEQAKLIALQKHIAEFEKSWNASQKQEAKKTTTKETVAKKAKTTAKKSSPKTTPAKKTTATAKPKAARKKQPTAPAAAPITELPASVEQVEKVEEAFAVEA